MKNIIKQYIKLIIGIPVLLLSIVFFLFILHSKSLENGIIRDWIQASLEQKHTTVKILTGSEKNIDLITKCIDKVSLIKDSEKALIKDITSLCLTGILLKDNI